MVTLRSCAVMLHYERQRHFLFRAGKPVEKNAAFVSGEKINNVFRIFYALAIDVSDGIILRHSELFEDAIAEFENFHSVIHGFKTCTGNFIADDSALYDVGFTELV